MSARALTIHVDSEAARFYEAASAELRQKLDALLSLKLCETARSPRPLQAILDAMSDKAQARGLTPELLESMLEDS